MRISTLVGSDKGGVGKSMLAQIIVAAHDNARIDLKVVEVDHQRKLSSLFGDRIDLSISPLAYGNEALDAVGLRARGGFQFDRIFDVWLAGNCLTDLGANITSPLFDWMHRSSIVELAALHGVVFRYVAVAGPDDQALRSAAETLRQARTVLGAKAELFLVLNDPGSVAGFEPYRKIASWTDLHSACRDLDVTVIELPACVSGVMEWGKAYGWSLLDLIDPRSNALGEIRKVASYNTITMREHLREFENWIGVVQTRLMPLFSAMMGDESRSAEGKVVHIRQSA